jgi:hypothetical protein
VLARDDFPGEGDCSEEFARAGKRKKKKKDKGA